MSPICFLRLIRWGCFARAWRDAWTLYADTAGAAASFLTADCTALTMFW